VVASEIPMVTVPNVVSYDESRASDQFAQDRLQMGKVTQRESDQPSGTVLMENPPAGTRVRAGSSVSVVVSQQFVPELSVMVDQPNPEAGSPVKFHAHLDREGPGFQYQFNFGDGDTEVTGGESTVTHVYENSGAYVVSAVATRGAVKVESPAVGVTATDVTYQVALSATPQKAKPGSDVAFIVKNSRAGFQPKYRFDFADGTQSEWSAEPFAQHKFESGGTYAVKVSARIGNGPVVESAAQNVKIERPVPIPLAAVVFAGLAGLAGGGFVYHGWKAFKKLVRAVPRFDPGKQEIHAGDHKYEGTEARLRVVWPRGEQVIHWAGAGVPGKAEGHD
jgi:hypothetical protein